jgi:hypothetical protein
MTNVGDVERSKSVNLYVSIVWSVWKTRNDWVFNNNLIKTPKSIAYMALGFLKWKKMLKVKDQQLIKTLLINPKRHLLCEV